MENYRFLIKGKVQGVYYRKNIEKNALKEEFSGYVKNLDDGNVEACVTCSVTKLEKFLGILQKGSPNSIVEKIEQYSCDEVFTGKFEIRY